jgi:hypothetical protein
MRARQDKTTKRDRLAARLARGSQPLRRREQGKRFDRHNQPRGRGRPKGARNLLQRGVIEAILIAFSQLGEDLRGKGGLVGYFRRIGRYDLKTSAMLLRATIPLTVNTQQKHEVTYKSVEEARAELQRAGIFIKDIFGLEHVKPKVIDAEATEVAQNSEDADDGKANTHSAADDGKADTRGKTDDGDESA